MIIRSPKTISRILVLSMSLFMVEMSPLASRVESASPQWIYVTEGVGAAGVFIDKSTEQDVLSAFGDNYEVISHNKYSVEIKYADLGVSFYYCLKDKQKKIFCITVQHGMTSKGVVLGQSTLKDVYDLYGKEDDTGQCSTGSCVYEYKGVQFLVEGEPKIVGDKEVIEPSEMKVVQIDVVSPDKSSNFCDEFAHAEESKPAPSVQRP